jgi:hypothetical protein
LALQEIVQAQTLEEMRNIAINALNVVDSSEIDKDEGCYC